MNTSVEWRGGPPDARYPIRGRCPACCAWAGSGAARRPPVKVPRNARRSNTALWLAASSRRDGAGRPAGQTYTSAPRAGATISAAPSRARLHGSWAASLPAGEPISAGRPRCHFSFAQVLEVLTAHCETSSELYQRIQLPPAAGRERAVEGARGLLRGGQLGPVRRGARGVEHLDRGLLGPGVLPPAVSESGGARSALRHCP